MESTCHKWLPQGCKVESTLNTPREGSIVVRMLGKHGGVLGDANHAMPHTFPCTHGARCSAAVAHNVLTVMATTVHCS